MADRQGWGRLGWRKVGRPPTSGAPSGLPGVSDFWDATKWYPALDFQLGGSTTVPMSVAGAADILYAQQKTFDRAGTITDLGQFIANNNGRVWMAVYDSDPAAPQVPRTRLFDVEKVAVGFQCPVTATGLTIAVTAGATLWFAAVYNAGGVGGGCFNISPANLEACNGSNWDETVHAPPTVPLIAGYKPAYAYARPPATFPASPTPILTNQANVPCLMYRFNPS